MSSQRFVLVQESESVFAACNQITEADARRKPHSPTPSKLSSLGTSLQSLSGEVRSVPDLAEGALRVRKPKMPMIRVSLILKVSAQEENYPRFGHGDLNCR